MTGETSIIQAPATMATFEVCDVLKVTSGEPSKSKYKSGDQGAAEAVLTPLTDKNAPPNAWVEEMDAFQDGYLSRGTVKMKIISIKR